MRRHLALAAAIAAVGLLPALVLSAGSAGSGPASADCSVAMKSDHLPDVPASFRAGAAGVVVLTSPTIRSIAVSSVATAPAFRAIVDKARGGSVEVYFGGKDSQVVFGAEAVGRQLEVRVTSCV